MARWLSRDGRERVSAVVAEWFSPHRWTLNDQILAIAAAVLAVSVFLPWYRAVLSIRNTPLNGYLIRPRGTVSGLIVHEFLWALFGLGLLQVVVLVARHAPGRPPRTIPGYGPALLVTSAISFALALAAFVLKPNAWYGNVSGGEITINVGWDYGAAVAVIAAIASLVVAWTIFRDPAAR